MQVRTLLAGVAVSVAALAALPAAAQVAPTFYGNVGYTAVDSDDVTLGAIGGRVGAQFTPNFGAELEAGVGVKSDEFNESGVNVKAELEHTVAAYAVGFVPVAPNLEVLGRVGYGSTKLKASALGVSADDTDESWNYGVGAQYTFDGVNGVRADWTRHDFGDNGDADAWSLSYVRKF